MRPRADPKNDPAGPSLPPSRSYTPVAAQGRHTWTLPRCVPPDQLGGMHRGPARLHGHPHYRGGGSLRHIARRGNDRRASIAVGACQKMETGRRSEPAIGTTASRTQQQVAARVHSLLFHARRGVSALSVLIVMPLGDRPCTPAFPKWSPLNSPGASFIPAPNRRRAFRNRPISSSRAPRSRVSVGRAQATRTRPDVYVKPLIPVLHYLLHSKQLCIHRDGPAKEKKSRVDKREEK